jgi:hypothetical protein
MLHDPAIESGRAYLVEIIRQCTWQISYSNAITLAARTLINQNLQRVLPQFVEESMTALDFGWCGFEIIWRMADHYYHIGQPKWLEPEFTHILVDAHGTFAGLRQGQIDLDTAKSLCVTLRRARSSPSDYYGCSRLEPVRVLWAKMKPNASSRRRLFEAYLGDIDSPHWFALAIQPVLTGLEKSLNELLALLVRLNFGAAEEKWARISFERARKKMESQ